MRALENTVMNTWFDKRWGPNFAVKQWALLLRIREILGSTSRPGDRFQANSLILPQTRPRPLSSLSFPIHCSQIILSPNAVYPQLRAESLNKSLINTWIGGEFLG
jgi:hypothetical protein